MSFHIPPVDKSRQPEIQDNIDQKTKPPGALGLLESLARNIALVQNKVSEPLTLNSPIVLAFAADHGIAKQGVSIAPSDVTAQMVQNFLVGGAAINVFCKTNQCDLAVINAGVKLPILLGSQTSVRYLDLSVAPGTLDFSECAAMTNEQLQYCFDAGRKAVSQLVSDDCDVVAFGEMGIANTSAASAMLALLSGKTAIDCVGRGTGIDDRQLQTKGTLIEKARQRVIGTYADALEPLVILREVGGFEIAQMTAAMLTVAEQQRLILVDGFISTTAALLACRLYPQAQDYMVFSHCSEEPAHKDMLALMQASPLLQLGLRLGEGTGAVLALPLLRNAVAFYNDMATFQSAGVKV